MLGRDLRRAQAGSRGGATQAARRPGQVLLHKPAGHRPLHGGLRGSLLRRAARRDRGRGAGRADRGRRGPPGPAEQEAPPRAREGRVRRDPQGDTETVKKAIAMKLIKSPTVRKAAMKALGNKKVRSTITKQVTKRVFGKEASGGRQ